jgi:hypothetical protein
MVEARKCSSRDNRFILSLKKSDAAEYNSLKKHENYMEAMFWECVAKNTAQGKDEKI